VSSAERDGSVPEILWRPSRDAIEQAQVSQFARWIEKSRGIDLPDYSALWEWSVSDIGAFWSDIWDYFEIVGDRSEDVLVGREMPGTRWFPTASVNWAENVLARVQTGPSVLGYSQTRPDPKVLSGADLVEQVARARAGLKRLGIGLGDTVAAYLPNIPEALVLLLAVASLGAIYTACPPEFGVKAVLDRLRQTEPKLLVATAGYLHRGRPVDRTATISEIAAGLPSVRNLVVIPYLPGGPIPAGSGEWDELLGQVEELSFVRVPFGHPLYILYSSGTSGPPKPIVHGHGGVLLEHTKLHHLHHDLRPDDRFFWYSTTGWVMWNYLVSGLLSGAAVVLYDGDPSYPDLGSLWKFAADAGVTVFGASAPFLLACRKAGVSPKQLADLSAIRQVGSTGAPLPADGARWVYENVGTNVLLISASGGTDVATAFVAGTPTLPVTAGEIACRCLAVKVEAFDEEGRSVVGSQGELVITEPMPSMPVGFWGDVDGSRYHSAYFERYPGVWSHGDWITITERGTCVITGRSDATLNRGGVRLGTSDFYETLDAVPEIVDSLVVHLEDAEGGAGELVMFVQVSVGGDINAVRSTINSLLRTALSPRHVPDTILETEKVPRTSSGKRMEIPVKRILQGTPMATAVNLDAIGDLAVVRSLEAIGDMAREKRQGSSAELTEREESS
jgi:acetoacetyl-CoA synthetase